MNKKIAVLCVGLNLFLLSISVGRAEDTESELPDLSLGDTTEPSASNNNLKEELRVSESAAGSNRARGEDNFYLPPPIEAMPIPSAPGAGAYSNNYSTVSDGFSGLTGTEYKPPIALFLGNSWFHYRPNVNYAGSVFVLNDDGTVATQTNGEPVVRTEPPLDGVASTLAWSVAGRFANFKDTVSLWAHVGMFSGFQKYYRLGVYSEFSFGRRIQLIAGLTRAQNYVWWPGGSHDDVRVKFSDYFMGAGAQYDAIVEPHYSVGVRGYLERDSFTITLSLSLEPAPSQRLSNLNYRETIW